MVTRGDEPAAHHLGQTTRVLSVETLIFSKKFGEKRFNLDVEERAKGMERLLAGEEVDATDAIRAAGQEPVEGLVAIYFDGSAKRDDQTDHAIERICRRESRLCRSAAGKRCGVPRGATPGCSA